MRRDRDIVEEQITAYLLGELSGEDAAAVRRRLESDERCRALAEELQPTLELLRGALAAPAPGTQQLDETHRERVRSSLRGAQRLRRFPFARPLAVAAVLLLTSGILVYLLLPARRTLRVAKTVPAYEVTIGRDESLELESIPEPAAPRERAPARVPATAEVMRELHVRDEQPLDAIVVHQAMPEDSAARGGGAALQRSRAEEADAIEGVRKATLEMARRAQPVQPRAVSAPALTASPPPARTRRLRASADASRPVDELVASEAVAPGSLDRIVLPGVRVRNMPLSQVLMLLQEQSRVHDPAGVGVRMLGPEIQGEEALVTLELGAGPLATILDAVAEQAGVPYRLEEGHTVRFSP